MKYFISIFLLLLLPLQNQKSVNINLNFVEASLNWSAKEMAGKLIPNGYKPRFTKYDFAERINGEVHIAVSVETQYHTNSSYPIKLIDYYFGYKPYKTYKKLKKQIINNCQKTETFWSKRHRTYIVTYRTKKGNYIYLWQNGGPFKDKDGKIHQNYEVTITNKSIHPTNYFN